MMELCCLLVNHRCLFRVAIEEHELGANTLKETIKLQKPELVQCAAHELTLYLAKSGGDNQPMMMMRM